MENGAFNVASYVVIALDTDPPILTITGNLIAIPPQNFNLTLHSNKPIGRYILTLIEGMTILPIGAILSDTFTITVEIPTTYLPNGLLMFSARVMDQYGNEQTLLTPIQVKRPSIFDLELEIEQYFPTTIILR